jgi:hypothetical protein
MNSENSVVKVKCRKVNVEVLGEVQNYLLFHAFFFFGNCVGLFLFFFSNCVGLFFLDNCVVLFSRSHSGCANSAMDALLACWYLLRFKVFLHVEEACKVLLGCRFRFTEPESNY